MTVTIARHDPATSELRGALQLGPILLAAAASPARAASRAAGDLARGLGVPVHVVHTWMPLNTTMGPAGQPAIDVELAYEQPAEEVLRAQVAELRHDGVQVAGEHLQVGIAAEEVAGVASRIGAQLVVTGSRGLGLIKRVALGSVSQGVVNATTVPVLVVRNGDHAWPPERVLVGCDGSQGSRVAAASAAAIGRATGAGVTMVTVITPDVLAETLPGEAAEAAGAMIRTLADGLSELYQIPIRTEVVTGGTAQVLLSMAATSGPTLLAVGSHGDGAFRRIALGSVSMAVLHGAEGPVLIAHSGPVAGG